MRDLFTNGRLDPLSRGWAYAQMPKEANDCVVGKIATPAHDIFISVASAIVEGKTYYTLVTVIVEPMNMGNVTLNVLNEGIAANKRESPAFVLTMSHTFCCLPDAGGDTRGRTCALKQIKTRLFNPFRG